MIIPSMSQSTSTATIVTFAIILPLLLLLLPLLPLLPHPHTLPFTTSTITMIIIPHLIILTFIIIIIIIVLSATSHTSKPSVITLTYTDGPLLPQLGVRHNICGYNLQEKLEEGRQMPWGKMEKDVSGSSSFTVRSKFYNISVSLVVSPLCRSTVLMMVGYCTVHFFHFLFNF